MIDALQVVINGLLVGLVYGLVAVSFVVIYRSSRIVNLAQGEILLLGALFIWTFTLGVKLPWGIGVPIALICCIGMALILERALFRPLIGESPYQRPHLVDDRNRTCIHPLHVENGKTVGIGLGGAATARRDP